MSTASASSSSSKSRPAAESAEIRRRRDPETAQRREVAVVDHLGQRARVDDLLEHLVEALAVAARGGRGEAEQRAVEAGLEDAELAQDAQVVVGRGVVALVVDDEPHVAAAQHAREPLLVQRADRADEHLRLRRRPVRAALDRDDGVALERALELLPRLRQQLLAVGEHQHLASREPGEVREDHGLAGARRQVDQQATPARAARCEHGIDRGALVGTQIAGRVGRQRGSHTPTSAALAKDCRSFVPPLPVPCPARRAPEETVSTQPHNPLHGITLEQILNELVAHYGWPELGQQVNIRCFTTDPSIPSSLKFLRRTPWAREKVESLYRFMLREQKRRDR